VHGTLTTSPQRARRATVLRDTPCLMAGSILQLFLVLCVFVCQAGCVVTREAQHPVRQGWYPSIESLTAALSAAVVAGDRQQLAELTITEQEYADYIWPHLPVAQIPQWQSHRDFVWQQHLMRSEHGLERVLAQYGGTKLNVKNVMFGNEAVRYGKCRVISEPIIMIQDADGKEKSCKLFGSLVEMNGFYKVFSYNID